MKIFFKSWLPSKTQISTVLLIRQGENVLSVRHCLLFAIYHLQGSMIPIPYPMIAVIRWTWTFSKTSFLFQCTVLNSQLNDKTDKKARRKGCLLQNGWILEILRTVFGPRPRFWKIVLKAGLCEKIWFWFLKKPFQRGKGKLFLKKLRKETTTFTLQCTGEWETG